MKHILIGASAASLFIALPAHACHNSKPASSFNVSCENGVSVVRGTPLATPAPPVVVTVKVKTPKADPSTAILKERLALQKDRIEDLEDRLDAQTRNARRSRYGRTYYGSPFLFGNSGLSGRPLYRGYGSSAPIRRKY